MSPIALRLKDSTFITGISFIILSLFIFLVPAFSNNHNENMLGIFAFNFVLACIYFLVCLVNGRFKRGSKRLHIIFIFLILALISAYSLNREMNLFEDSTTWLCIVITVSCINYVAFTFFTHFPVFIKHLMCFVLGIATILFIYMSVYLAPFYAVGAALFFVLGISLHTFVPFAITLFSIILIRKAIKLFPAGLYSVLIGAVIVISVAVGFVIKWNSVVDTINREYRNELIEGDNVLPAWVRVSQKLEAGPITERVLKAGLVYSLPVEDASFIRMPQRNFSEPKKHDPLVMLSAMTTTTLQISDEEKINILKSMYDSRHQAEERLWSGENLVTDHVHTNVKVWPSLRVAYTEKVITVSNNNRYEWGMSEEAIYTFHLPAGSVVTSLSLWIDGVEEKGILTSKEKAATAYRTIVGTERRDPSVIHWQEGNRVSVRVFPVMAGESRMFKVGITSPLHVRTGDLVYNNIWFDGPSVNKTQEAVKVELGDSVSAITPYYFTDAGNNKFTREGKYHADWSISCPAKPLGNQQFSFNNKTYAVAPYVSERAPAIFQKVYLDINCAWTTEEFSNVWELVKDKEVYAYDNVMTRMSEQNKDEIFYNLKQLRFSLFPFYKVHEPGKSIIVTKSCEVSPNLDDLNQTPFLHQLQASFNTNNKYRLFNLDSKFSPFLASLFEKRYFHYEAGNTEVLAGLLQSDLFPVQDENEDEVIVHQAGIKLIRKDGSLEQSTAPDHLMRLFSYNHLMQQMGAQPIQDSVLTGKLVEEARESYIVTPLSSLVVLESQHDYDRFDIKDGENSLKNASSKSTGAVPEPHEWALIILAIIMLLYAKYPFLFKRFLWKA